MFNKQDDSILCIRCNGSIENKNNYNNSVAKDCQFKNSIHKPDPNAIGIENNSLICNNCKELEIKTKELKNLEKKINIKPLETLDESKLDNDLINELIMKQIKFSIKFVNIFV